MTIATRAAAARPEETAGLLAELWNASLTGNVFPQWDIWQGKAIGRRKALEDAAKAICPKNSLVTLAQKEAAAFLRAMIEW